MSFKSLLCHYEFKKINVPNADQPDYLNGIRKQYTDFFLPVYQFSRLVLFTGIPRYTFFFQRTTGIKDIPVWKEYTLETLLTSVAGSMIGTLFHRTHLRENVKQKSASRRRGWRISGPQI